MSTVPDQISLIDLSNLWIQKALQKIAAENEQPQEAVETEDQG